jgi:hypothetical protein
MRPVFLAMITLLLPLAAAGRDFRTLGQFHNVTSNDGGEHCGGYSLGLWQYRGAVIGLLHVHAGLCGDPPCAAVTDARLDAGTGRLAFASSVDGRRIGFRGTVTGAAVEGELDGKRVRLARDPDGSDPEFEPNRSVSAWCGFWTSVPRCKGVRELCRSIAAPTAK